MFSCEVIAVGTELLLGQIANTNAQYISQKLAQIGVPIYYHNTVGDNSKRLMEVVLQAQKRSNLIIFTGGLGPTKDDLTKETVAELLNKKMVLDQESYQKISDFFKQRNIIMTDNNQKQAMVFEGSTIFPNDYGLAVGVGIIENATTFIFLPGPPNEMKPMLDNYVVPWILKQYNGHTFYSILMRFIGIGEAALEEKILDLIELQENPTIAPLANDAEVTIRITAHEKDENLALALIKPIESEIHKRLKEYHFGNGDENIEEVVFKMLERLKLSISISESITGGLIGAKLTSLSGSSTVYRGGLICYSNEIKETLLNIPDKVLTEKGAVSAETAGLMAEQTLKLFNSNIGIGITGIAGPNTIEDKPVGIIYIGISEKNAKTIIKELRLSGNRNFIRHRAAKYTFYYLWSILKERFEGNK